MLQAWQSQAIAVTKLTKPGDRILAEPCTCDVRTEGGSQNQTAEREVARGKGGDQKCEKFGEVVLMVL